MNNYNAIKNIYYSVFIQGEAPGDQQNLSPEDYPLMKRGVVVGF